MEKLKPLHNSYKKNEVFKSLGLFLSSTSSGLSPNKSEPLFKEGTSIVASHKILTQ